MEAHGPNLLEAAHPVPEWRKFLRQFADPLIYLLIAAVVISLAAWLVEGRSGVPFEALVIAVIIVLNAVLGHVQETRAERAVAAQQRMAAPMAGVLRDGQERAIPAAAVVPGDILLLEEGDAVCADARVIEAASLMIAEASLTGESEAVLKDVAPLAAAAARGDRVNMVFNGTTVVCGRGRAVVTATAMATEIGRVGRVLGIAVVVIAAVVMGTMFLTSGVESASDAVAVLLIDVSLAVAAVPEGLPAILSLVLALGVSAWPARTRSSSSSLRWRRSAPPRWSARTRPAPSPRTR